MILDVISVVLLLIILGLLLFLGQKRFASMEQELAALIQHKIPDPLPPQITDFDKIRNEFRKYVKRESTILQDDGGDAPFVRFKAGIPNPNGNGLPLIWIRAWIPDGGGIISAAISVDLDPPFFESHYRKLETNKSEIEAAFSFDTAIETVKAGGKAIHEFRVNKTGVDLTQKTNWETEFRWLRENLEKLYWVLQIQDTGNGWDAL